MMKLKIFLLLLLICVPAALSYDAFVRVKVNHLFNSNTVRDVALLDNEEWPLQIKLYNSSDDVIIASDLYKYYDAYGTTDRDITFSSGETYSVGGIVDLTPGETYHIKIWSGMIGAVDNGERNPLGGIETLEGGEVVGVTQDVAQNWFVSGVCQNTSQYNALWYRGNNHRSSLTYCDGVSMEVEQGMHKDDNSYYCETTGFGYLFYYVNSTTYPTVYMDLSTQPTMVSISYPTNNTCNVDRNDKYNPVHPSVDSPFQTITDTDDVSDTNNYKIVIPEPAKPALEFTA